MYCDLVPCSQQLLLRYIVQYRYTVCKVSVKLIGNVFLSSPYQSALDG